MLGVDGRDWLCVSWFRSSHELGVLSFDLGAQDGFRH